MAFDPSKYGAVEITQERLEPSTFDPARYGAVEIQQESRSKDQQAAPVTTTAEQSPAPSQVGSMPQMPEGGITTNMVKELPAAVIGGLASGGADFAQGVTDIPVFIMDKLGTISPKTAEKLYKANKESADLFRPDSGSWSGGQSDIFTQGKQAHPVASTVAKTAVDVAGLAGGTRALSNAIPLSMGAGAGALPTAASVAGRAVGQGLIGTAAADPENKDMAFGINALISPALEAVGLGVQQLGNKATKIGEIADKVKSYSKEAVNKAYSVIRKLPFEEADQAATYQISRKIQDFVANTDMGLSKVQTRLLNNLSSQLSNAKSHDDVLTVLQNMGKTGQKFSGLEANSTLFEAFNGLKSDIKGIITNASAKYGSVGALDTASSMARTAKIANKVFAGIEVDPTSINFTKAANRLNAAISKIENVKDLKEATEALRGLEKLSRAAGNSLKIPSLATTSAGSVGLGTAAYAAGLGPMGAAAGTVVGGAVGAAINAMIKSQSGQAMLRAIGKPSVSVTDSMNILKAISTGGADKYLNQTNPQQEDFMNGS